jgi:hypothetical protein
MFKKYSFNILLLYKRFFLAQLKYIAVFFLSVVLMVKAIAQSAEQVGLEDRFSENGQHILQEKIFVHTDKVSYLAGEICWFKIYYVDAFFHRPLNLSKIAYVQLLDKNNKSVLEAKISLKEGSGSGSLQLPVSIISGNYKIRAYTNWMKNFSADYFFEKSLAIINSRKVYELDTIVRKKAFALNFFPEGGNLVNGIESKVAFRILGSDGKGITCGGVIISDKGDTAVRYNSFKFGIGNFLLKPESGRTYKAVVTIPGETPLVQELPVAGDNGYVMALTSTDKNQLKVTVRTVADNNNASQSVFLFAHTRGSVKLVLKTAIGNGYAEFFIDKNKLGDGISHFTIFNNERKPVCERLYFKHPAQQLKLEMAADSREYELRKKINIHVNALNQDGKAARPDMSMAVYRIDSLQRVDEININNYFWLSSDLTGQVESPEYYFNDAAGTAEAMDNLMLTHGWRRFRLENLSGNNKPVFDFIPELQGHMITGKITKIETGLPGKDIGVFISVPGTRTQFRTAISDANGRFKFDMKDFYSEGEIIVQTNSRQDSGYNIEISSPFFEKYGGSVLSPFLLSQQNEGLLLSHHVGVQIQNTFAAKFNQFSSPVLDTNAFYFKPDAEYLLDNYVRFTTMEEVLREYVSQVNVRKKDGQFHLPVEDVLKRKFFDSDPLLLLDGLPVFDINKFMNYDPLRIKKLEVMTRPYYFGNMYFEGITNFITYQGNLPGYELDPNALVIDYEGLQLQREFIAPAYETREQVDSRLPDFRQLLYWNPDLKTNESGKQEISFYSSDQAGQYAVVLQGLTADGKTGYKVIQFAVKEAK